MGIDGQTSGGSVARVEDAITAAKAAIDNDTGRSFDQTTATRTFGAPMPYTLEVPDLVSITTLKVDDDDDGVFETTLAASEYELDTFRVAQDGWPFETVRLLNRPWPTAGRRRRRVEIAGVWGWAAVPAPINQACSLLAARLSQRPSGALFGIQTVGDAAEGIRSRDPDYLALIRPYQKPLVA